MKASVLLTAMTMLAFSVAPSFAINDLNNEPVCSQIGNVDPRCF